MKKYVEQNRNRWNELVEIHSKSKFYSLESYIQGPREFRQYELDEIGDLDGKKILHLQCHFGMDTLSLAELGAQVVGLDFTDKGIKKARWLREKINISGSQAKFLKCDMMELDNLNHEAVQESSFDIIYTSHGTIVWLPDLKPWARGIAKFLKPGGFFYMMDAHPLSHVFDPDHETDFVVKYDYFHKQHPFEFDFPYTYTDSEKKIKNSKSFEWHHHISEIINVLSNEGLKIEFFNEHNFNSWQQFPFLVKKGDRWYLPETFDNRRIPLSFSLKAVKL